MDKSRLVIRLSTMPKYIQPKSSFLAVSVCQPIQSLLSLDAGCLQACRIANILSQAQFGTINSLHERLRHQLRILRAGMCMIYWKAGIDLLRSFLLVCIGAVLAVVDIFDLCHRGCHLGVGYELGGLVVECARLVWVVGRLGAYDDWVFVSFIRERGDMSRMAHLPGDLP